MMYSWYKEFNTIEVNIVGALSLTYICMYYRRQSFIDNKMAGPAVDIATKM